MTGAFSKGTVPLHILHLTNPVLPPSLQALTLLLLLLVQLGLPLLPNPSWSVLVEFLVAVEGVLRLVLF